MKEYKDLAHPMKLPKINPEIESSQQYQSKTFFVMNDRKSIYSTQNYVRKAISISSNMKNSVLKASDADNGIPRTCEVSKIVAEHNNPLTSYFRRVHSI